MYTSFINPIYEKSSFYKDNSKILSCIGSKKKLLIFPIYNIKITYSISIKEVESIIKYMKKNNLSITFRSLSKLTSLTLDPKKKT